MAGLNTETCSRQQKLNHSRVQGEYYPQSALPVGGFPFSSQSHLFINQSHFHLVLPPVPYLLSPLYKSSPGLPCLGLTCFWACN